MDHPQVELGGIKAVDPQGGREKTGRAGQPHQPPVDPGRQAAPAGVLDLAPGLDRPSPGGQQDQPGQGDQDQRADHPGREPGDVAIRARHYVNIMKSGAADVKPFGGLESLVYNA